MRLKSLFSMLLIMGSLALFSQNYGDLPDQYQDEVTRLEWRKIVKQNKLPDGVIGISPIEQIIFNQQEAVKARNSSGVSIEGYGRDIMLPLSVRDRVLNECDRYPWTVIIADTGVDVDHVEFEGPWWLPSVNYSGDNRTKHFHGTFVGSIVWQMVGDLVVQKRTGKFKDAQVLGSTGSGNLNNAVNMASSEASYFRPNVEAGEGVFFCNSWGYTGPAYAPLEDLIVSTTAEGFIWLAAAGNSGVQTQSYPASSANITAAAAVDQNLNVAGFSNKGIYVDCAAPGVMIDGAMPNDQRGRGNGTSYSNPFVVGFAALAYGKYGPILQGANMETYVKYICTDIPPGGYDIASGEGIPYVATMLDTDPCDVPGIDCDGNPNPPDGPGDPDPPTPPTPPVATSSLTFNTGDHIIRWKRESENDWRILSVKDMEITVEANLSQTEIYDQYKSFVASFFNYRGIVLLDEMGYIDATWWTGQFLEYIGRNEGFPLQVTYVKAHDEYGHYAKAVGFDRATANGTGVRWVFVDLDKPNDYTDKVPVDLRRWLVKASWTVDNTVELKGRPGFTFSDQIGMYYTYVSSAREPTIGQINKNPPFEGAKVGQVIQIVQR